MKIGILGGTFNPVHNAHVILAKESVRQFDLDCLWFMPSKNPPHKSNTALNDVARLEMLQAMINELDDERYSICDVEMYREGASYSSDTLRILNERYPDDELFFIIGGDSIMYFDTWHEPDEILKLATVLVSGRTDISEEAILRKSESLMKEFGGRICLVRFSDIDISSGYLRENFYYADCSVMVPKSVYDYILKNGLYRPLEIMKKYMKKYARMVSTVRGSIKTSRFTHTMGVCKVALKLANCYKTDEEKAFLAALLHDCAKGMSFDEMTGHLKETGNFREEYADFELSSILHGKAGASLASLKYGVDDPEIIDAISFHTTGKPAMSKLAKIIFVADYIEPNRSFMSSPTLNELRLLAEKDLDLAVYFELKNVISHLEEAGRKIDNIAFEALNYYTEIVRDRTEYISE